MIFHKSILEILKSLKQALKVKALFLARQLILVIQSEGVVPCQTTYFSHIDLLYQLIRLK